MDWSYKYYLYEQQLTLYTGETTMCSVCGAVIELDNINSEHQYIIHLGYVCELCMEES